MFVWRDKNGRIASVTGSVHARTLEYLKAEDEHRAVPSARTRPVSHSKSKARTKVDPESVKVEEVKGLKPPFIAASVVSEFTEGVSTDDDNDKASGFSGPVADER